MDNEDKKLLIELICNEQTEMIVRDHNTYMHKRYLELERLKVKIKDM